METYYHCITPTGSFWSVYKLTEAVVVVIAVQSYPCSRCCAWARSQGSTGSCRSPRCFYRYRFHTAVCRTRQYLPETTRDSRSHARLASERLTPQKPPQTLTHAHGQVRRGLEAVVAQTAEAAQSVDAFAVTADVRDLLTLVTVWQNTRTTTRSHQTHSSLLENSLWFIINLITMWRKISDSKKLGQFRRNECTKKSVFHYRDHENQPEVDV